MSRSVVLSARASGKLQRLLEYLEQEWSLQVKQDFISKLDRALEVIALFPNSFELIHRDKAVHRCVITKQTTIYYRHDEKTIFILTIFDNRQHPKRLKKELQ
jgi:plasmid stabilization system protein ParE